MKKNSVPFNRPGIHGREIEYIIDAVERGHLSGDGHYTKLCNEKICELTGAKHALVVHSCTAALEIASILLNLGPGDEVIMPSFTFVSTANSVVLRGATPVFVDISPITLNVDPDQIELAVTNKTKAIFVVHYAGVICDMGAINEIARKHNLAVIEDAAQALGSSQGGRMAGNFGDAACFSFHETKNIISGEGGAFVTNNEELFSRAEIVREKGTNRKQFFRGAVDKYTWVDVGSSYLPSELIAAFLYGQLELVHDLNSQRVEAWNVYHKFLKNYEEKGVLTRPIALPKGEIHNGHMYYVLFPDGASRRRFIEGMKSEGITTPFHYIPLHSSPAGLKYGRYFGNMNVTDNISERLVRLPMFAGVREEIADVLDAVDKVLGSI